MTAVPVSLRERKKRQTRERIADAAHALFIQQGFDAVTVESIADAAEISKPTFFRYFTSKGAVLAALIERMDSEFISHIACECQRRTTTESRLLQFMRSSAGYIEKHPDSTRLLLASGMADFGEHNVTSSRMSRLNEAMANLVVVGQEQGDIRTDTDIELLVQILVGSYFYGLLNWLSKPEDNLTSRLEQTAYFLAATLAPLNDQAAKPSLTSTVNNTIF